MSAAELLELWKSDEWNPHPWGPPATIQEKVEAMYLMKLVSVSIYCLLIYDILLTSAKEVRHIYRSRASLVKLLWYLNRWLVPITLAIHFWNIFASNPSRKFCTMTGDAGKLPSTHFMM